MDHPFGRLLPFKQKLTKMNKWSNISIYLSYLSDNYDDKYGKHIAIHSNYVSSDLLPEHDIQLFLQPVKQII